MPKSPSNPRYRLRAGRLAVLGAAGIVTAAVLATAGTVPVAQAAPVTVDPLAPALGFNAFVEDETVLVSTESEGGIATGGNLVVSGSYNVNIHDASTFTAPGDSVPSALVVGGQVDFTQDPAASVVQVHDYVKVGDLAGADVLNTDSNNASVNTRLVVDAADYNSTPRIELNLQQPIDSVGPASPIDFDAAFAELRLNAADLWACDANEIAMQDSQGGTVPKGEVQQNQQIRITLPDDGDPATTNILNVTGEDLNAMSDLTFVNEPTEGQPLLINVDTSGTGGELDWRVASQAGISGLQAPYILWNFNDATRLRITSGDTVEGSILAPDADYSDIDPSNVEGQIIAKNASLGEVGENGGEIHQFPFAATFACETDVSPTESPSDDNGTGSQEPDGDDDTTDADESGEPDEPCPHESDEPDPSDQPGSEEPDGPDGSNEPGSDEPGSEEPDGPDGSDRTDGPDGTDESDPDSDSVSGARCALAATGGEIAAFAAVSAVLVAGGAVALIASRSRRTDESE
ncbi:collagen-binding domain-containing protein [Glycomyces luteolus]|nr:collagen-binding domain-containing protein [Glycomyces luteolus]